MKEELTLWLTYVHNTSLEERSISFNINNVLYRVPSGVVKDEFMVNEREEFVNFTAYEYYNLSRPYFRINFVTIDGELRRITVRYIRYNGLGLVEGIDVRIIEYNNNLTYIKSGFIKKDNIYELNKEYDLEYNSNKYYDVLDTLILNNENEIVSRDIKLNRKYSKRVKP